MNAGVKVAAFGLIAIGTAGLLMNEFLTDLGRAATVAFASLNVVGLVTLGYMSLARSRYSSFWTERMTTIERKLAWFGLNVSKFEIAGLLVKIKRYVQIDFACSRLC